MLIELSVANYRSFCERVTLSLEAEPRLSERDKSVDERNVAHTPHGDLLRVTGIYGANASGKSNLVRALATLRTLVLNSAREGQAGDALPAEPFRLDGTTTAEPSEIEVVFTDNDLQLRYGAAFTREKITHEWLFARPTDADHEERWFERTLQQYETGDAWRRDPGIERKTRKEALHLSAAAAWEHAQAQRILQWFRSVEIINGLQDASLTQRTATLLTENNERGDAVQSLIRKLDFGIDELRVTSPDEKTAAAYQELEASFSSLFAKTLPGLRIRTPPQKRIRTVRLGVEFDLADESAGTARAIALAGPVVEALATGQIMVIDEFDARLHTLLAKQIVELFQDPTINRRNAQLVFASHDTNLLTRTLLRRDQLWFVEKSHKTQATNLYSLAEIRLDDGKKVRNDARYEDDYLQGRYGAIPFFGNLRALLRDALGRDEE